MGRLHGTDPNGVINAFLRRMYMYHFNHFVSKRFDVDAVLVVMDRKFSTMVLSPAHYLHPTHCCVQLSNRQGSR